ncbi:MAG: glutamine--fructose-6-phosphate transaminase (isomerizing) [Alphaproteobacteria bacterium]|nr:glutamine--fructose-6-phosphate transaminase (isomerizing) [Alphaproteobacteria bacterium]
MCGIVGIINSDNLKIKAINVLSKLEYRGYDSAGVSFLAKNNIKTITEVGKISQLSKSLTSTGYNAFDSVIGHTRWATHGIVSKNNAHPFSNQKISLVCNGIIENYSELKLKYLKNYKKNIESDTETIFLVLNELSKKIKDHNKLIQKLVSIIKGHYAFLIYFSDTQEIFSLKSGSPLSVGKNADGIYFSSDPSALTEYVNNIYHLQDGDIIKVSVNTISHLNGKKVIFENQAKVVNEFSKGDFKHFMIKEIYEQPHVIKKTQKYYDADYFLDFRNKLKDLTNNLDSFVFVGCGTAYHACLVAKYYFEQFTDIDVSCEYASELRYKNISTKKNSIYVFISQSGETMDTLMALKYVKSKGYTTIVVTNSLESTMVREANITLPTFAMKEIGVASTKAFTCQLLALANLCIEIGNIRKNISKKEYIQLKQDLKNIPTKITKILKNSSYIDKVVSLLSSSKACYFIARNIVFPIALEGSLKLKEISYMHSEGFAGGEMKHGPIALIDKNVLSICLNPKNKLYEKSSSNCEEILARGGKVVVFSSKKSSSKKNLLQIIMPKENYIDTPFIYTIPLQLISYYFALNEGTDIDQPRNLAKSVTVE